MPDCDQKSGTEPRVCTYAPRHGPLGPAGAAPAAVGMRATTSVSSDSTKLAAKPSSVQPRVW
jgi:hypothetical protein